MTTRAALAHAYGVLFNDGRFHRSCLGALFAQDARASGATLRTLTELGAAQSSAATTAFLEHPSTPPDILAAAVSRCDDAQLLTALRASGLPAGRRAAILGSLAPVDRWTHVRHSDDVTSEEIQALWDQSSPSTRCAAQAAVSAMSNPATSRALVRTAILELAREHARGVARIEEAELLLIADAVTRHDLSLRVLTWRAPRGVRRDLRRLRRLTRKHSRSGLPAAAGDLMHRGPSAGPEAITWHLGGVPHREGEVALRAIRNPSVGVALARDYCAPATAGRILSSPSNGHLAGTRAALASTTSAGLLNDDALPELEPEVSYRLAATSPSVVTRAAALSNPHLSADQLQSLWDRERRPTRVICDLFTIHPNCPEGVRGLATRAAAVADTDVPFVDDEVLCSLAMALVADGAVAAGRSLPVSQLWGSSRYWPLLAHYAALAVAEHPTPPTDLAYVAAALALESGFTAGRTLGELLDAAAAVSS